MRAADASLSAFFSAACAWSGSIYPDLLPVEVEIRYHTGQKVRLLIPASALTEPGPPASTQDELSDPEADVLDFLREQSEPLVAKEVRDRMEAEKLIYGQSTIERALAKLCAKGLLRKAPRKGYVAVS